MLESVFTNTELVISAIKIAEKAKNRFIKQNAQFSVIEYYLLHQDTFYYPRRVNKNVLKHF